MSYLWLDKYKPKNLSDFINTDNEINTIINWLDCFKTKQIPKDFKNCLLVVGNSGVGKTSLIDLILNMNNYSITRFDASCDLSNDAIENRIINVLSTKNILSYMSIVKETAIIIDELDVIDSKKEFGSTKIIDLLSYNQKKFYKNKKTKKTKKKYIINNSPIICISNGKYSKKLKNSSKILYINPPNSINLETIIKRIMKNENFSIDTSIIQIIISLSQNDYRRCITILEDTFVYIKNNGSDKNLLIKKIYSLGTKNITQTIYDDANDIYKGGNSYNNLSDIYERHSKSLLLLTYENFIHIIDKTCYGNYKTKLKICIEYYNNFLHTNIFLQKMFNHWELQQYLAISFLSINNLMLKNKKPNTPLPFLHHSLITSKYNYRFYNLKFINTLSKKLDIDMRNFYITSFLLYNILYNSNDKIIRNYIKMIQRYSLGAKDFFKIIKLSILPPSINITKKLENKITKFF
uniref:AAA+ ATPase domain-containing protein n=1 Tax=viral metagenome TaxID=1070528 RepID=A0A6C0B2W4_9ZZZZ